MQVSFSHASFTDSTLVFWDVNYIQIQNVGCVELLNKFCLLGFVDGFLFLAWAFCGSCWFWCSGVAIANYNVLLYDLSLRFFFQILKKYSLSFNEIQGKVFSYERTASAVQLYGTHLGLPLVSAAPSMLLLTHNLASGPLLHS